MRHEIPIARGQVWEDTHPHYRGDKVTVASVVPYLSSYYVSYIRINRAGCRASVFLKRFLRVEDPPLDPIELERHYAVSREQWFSAPQIIRRTAEQDEKKGIPAAVCFHPEYGWYAIATAGQGPVVTKRASR